MTYWDNIFEQGIVVRRIFYDNKDEKKQGETKELKQAALDYTRLAVGISGEAT